MRSYLTQQNCVNLIVLINISNRDINYFLDSNYQIFEDTEINFHKLHFISHFIDLGQSIFDNKSYK